MTSPPNSHTLSDIFVSTSRPSSPSSSYPPPSLHPPSPPLISQPTTSPPSPSTSTSTSTSHPSPHSRPASSPPSYFPSSPSPSTTTSLPSPSSPRTPNPDIQRLQTTHHTAGYREGISSAKTSFLQRGFDEGYALGAELGLRVGFILGVLEGMLRAVASTAPTSGDGDGGAAGEQANVSTGKVLGEARRELAVEKVFAREWWDEEGVWRFDVGVSGGEGEDQGGGVEGGGEVTFRMVAEEHPLLKRWMERMRSEMGRVGVSEWGGFEGEEWEKGRVGEAGEGDGLV